MQRKYISRDVRIILCGALFEDICRFSLVMVSSSSTALLLYIFFGVQRTFAKINVPKKQKKNTREKYEQILFIRNTSTKKKKAQFVLHCIVVHNIREVTK